MPDEIVQMEEIASQNTYAIAGLKASTDWILREGMSSVHEAEAVNRDALLTLLRQCRALSIVKDQMTCERIGVVSALFDGLSPDEAELVLGRLGVAVRSGIQCAPFAHRFLGTLPGGTVRFSVSALTSEHCFKTLTDALAFIDSEL